MTFNPAKHHRRSIRLKDYDYSLAGAYFVTVCTKGRECLLGHVEKGAMVLSEQGRIVERCWRVLPRRFWDVELDEFIFMPNHIHGIIIINHDNGRGEAFAPIGDPPLTDKCFAPTSFPRMPRGTRSGSLGAVIQNFKSVSTRKINQMNQTPGTPLWHRNYHEHIIRDEDELNHIRWYIINNPLRWNADDENPTNAGNVPSNVAEENRTNET